MFQLGQIAFEDCIQRRADTAQGSKSLMIPNDVCELSTPCDNLVIP